MKSGGRYRRVVLRSGRRYVLCGLRELPPPVAEPKSEPAVGVWLPGMTFLLVLLFSAYLIGRPAGYPLGTDGAIQHANLAPFTINDFANASR